MQNPAPQRKPWLQLPNLRRTEYSARLVAARTITVAGILTLNAATARAQPTSVSERTALENANAPATKHVFSLTMSPLQLRYPVVEIMGEVKVLAKKRRALSLAFIAGYGQLSQTVESDHGLRKVTLNPTAGELGGQLVYYPMDEFRSLQVGVETLYVKYMGFQLAEGQSISSLGDGFAVGAFAGYKYIADNGLTFSAQVGADYMASRWHAPAVSFGQSSSAPSRWFPLVNLNLGWSF